MSKRMSADNRKQQILQILARMLEHNDRLKITTANIANNAGVSEATLYRHFANKEAMFQQLIHFAEHSIFGLIIKINNTDHPNVLEIKQIIAILLKFSEQNPGIIHLVLNAELIGQSEKLGHQSLQFFRRLKSQFKQNIQLLSQFDKIERDYLSLADMLEVFVIGKWQQFVFDEFKVSPMKHWQQHWRIFECILIK